MAHGIPRARFIAFQSTGAALGGRVQRRALRALSAGDGTPVASSLDGGWFAIVVSHPWHKSKDVPRMGHPSVVGRLARYAREAVVCRRFGSLQWPVVAPRQAAVLKPGCAKVNYRL